jgi:hypothetical protein
VSGDEASVQEIDATTWPDVRLIQLTVKLLPSVCISQCTAGILYLPKPLKV